LRCLAAPRRFRRAKGSIDLSPLRKTSGVPGSRVPTNVTTLGVHRTHESQRHGDLRQLVNLSWGNHATNAAGVLVEQSIDNTTLIASLFGSATTCLANQGMSSYSNTASATVSGAPRAPSNVPAGQRSVSPLHRVLTIPGVYTALRRPLNKGYLRQRSILRMGTRLSILAVLIT
jgi:hypothetical protein